MQIFIKRMTGKTVTIDASGGDTILLIKEKFQDKEGLSPAQVGLFFGGRELDDDKTLADCSIDKETTLTMIERVLAPAAPAAPAAPSSMMNPEDAAKLGQMGSDVKVKVPLFGFATTEQKTNISTTVSKECHVHCLFFLRRVLST